VSELLIVLGDGYWSYDSDIENCYIEFANVLELSSSLVKDHLSTSIYIYSFVLWITAYQDKVVQLFRKTRMRLITG